MVSTSCVRKLLLALHGLALLALFIRFMPWLIGSEEIYNMSNYELEVTEVPEWAMSFTVNHGKPIFFAQPVPSETPWYTLGVIVSFAIVILSGKALSNKIVSG